MKTNKKVLYVIIAFLIFFLLIAIVAGDNAPVEQRTESKTQKQEVEPEPSKKMSIDEDMLKSNFMEGCNIEGANKQFCECTWNYLVDQYGIEWLVDESINTYRTGDIPPEMFKAGKTCSQYLNVSQQIH